MGALRDAPVWRIARPVRGRLVVAGLLMAVGALSSLLPVAVAMALVDTLVQVAGGDPGDTARACFLLVALIVSLALSQVLAMGGHVISHFADATLAERLRQRQVTHLLRLPLAWFSRTATGRVKKVVQDDLDKVHYLIAHAVPDFVNGAVRPVASLAFLYLVDWRLGLLGTLPLVLAAACLPLYLKDISDKFARYNAGLADLSAAVVEFVRGIAPIKVFEVDGRGHRRFVERAEWHQRFYREWWDATKYGAALLHAATSPVLAVLVSGVGTALLVIHGQLPPAALVPAVLLAGNVASPLVLLIQVRRFLREANGAAADIDAFLALPIPALPSDEITPAGHEVDLTDVAFSYDGDHRALDGVSLRLRPGTVTALVGSSGSGKSTVASLVPRLVDPDEGMVRIGGVDTRRLSANQLYSEVAFVFQQPYLLEMSIRDNIAMGRPGAGETEVLAAATAAQIHDRILELPEGYDTIVGVGARLSGGEQQRISVARAVLMDAPVLVLDEATAFADPDSEAALQRALAELTRGRTLLVIAHRLHTVAHADAIHVLDRGRVVESGTHDELVAAGGVYARLWQSYELARTLGPGSQRAASRTVSGRA